MKVCSIVSLAIILCLLSAPAATFAKKGEKNFRQGIRNAADQQWDRAVEQFALAVASDPSNMEYQLHYRRALFNVSQSCMQQGRALAEQHDYIGAYNLFRRANAYDPVNKLASAEMERMLELQKELRNTSSGVMEKSRDGDAFVPSAYRQAPDGEKASAQVPRGQDPVATLRAQKLRVISYNGDLESFIGTLADQLDLNVVFDKQSFQQPRNLHINLKDVTTAKALDLIFLKERLFFQKVDRRTILVADQTYRPQYQQLVLRTFYLANIEPQDAQRLVQAAIPPSVARPQGMATIEKSTNSLTVRDTAENVRLIGELLKNIDKDRAEVVMDVQIYEVSSTDLLQIGNQLGTASTLANLGGASSLSVIGGSRQVAEQLFSAPSALGAALLVPSSTIALLQKKNRTRVVASTQIHAFDGEKSEVHIGQRVPVQTAQVYTGATTSPNSSTATGVYGTNGYPVITYEPTGLTLEFTPQVYPNLDVQVKMSIKSNDVMSGSTLTPTFTERTLSGTARIQNNQTMMIASVSQDQQSQTRAGLPLIGLVPVLGRLFTAPSREGKQTDIVVAVTPRVLRAPAITPRDQEMRLSGTQQFPTTESLEAMVSEADRDDQIASARTIPAQVNLQLPDQDPPVYLPAPKSMLTNLNPIGPQPRESIGEAGLPTGGVLPVNPTSRLSDALSFFTNSRPQALSLRNDANETFNEKQGPELFLIAESEKIHAGEKTKLKLMLRSEQPISFAALRLKFDPGIIALQEPLQNMTSARSAPTPYKAGEFVVLVSSATFGGNEALLTLTLEGLARGETAIEIVTDAIHLITPDGTELTARKKGLARITVK